MKSELADQIEDPHAAAQFQRACANVGIGAKGLPKLAAQVTKQTRLVTNKPRALAREHALAIYHATY